MSITILVVNGLEGLIISLKLLFKIFNRSSELIASVTNISNYFIFSLSCLISCYHSLIPVLRFLLLLKINYLSPLVVILVKNIIFTLVTDSVQYYSLLMHICTWSIGVELLFSIIFIPNHDIINIASHFMIYFSSSIYPCIYFRCMHFSYFLFLSDDLDRGNW